MIQNRQSSPVAACSRPGIGPQLSPAIRGETAGLPPIEQAAQIYAQHGLVLARDLEAYLRDPHAHVIKTPDMLLLARPVDVAQVDRWILEQSEANAWYVHLLVGRPLEAMREMPYPLPLCCWHRNFRNPNGPLHVVPTNRILNKLRPYHGR